MCADNSYFLNGKVIRQSVHASSIGENVVFQMTVLLTVLLPFLRKVSSIASTAQHTYIMLSMQTCFVLCL